VAKWVHYTVRDSEMRCRTRVVCFSGRRGDRAVARKRQSMGWSRVWRGMLRGGSLARWRAIIVAGVAMVGACVAQQLPSRDDPLYFYLARVSPTPSTLLRMPRSADELMRVLPAEPSALVQVIRWKLGEAAALPEQTQWLSVELQAFAFPNRSEWRTASAAYYAVGTWVITTHALLEVVWSDWRRREGENASAFDTVPHATLTLQTGAIRWRMGYGTLRWLGGYSGGMLVNDEMPAVPYAMVQFPVRIPLLGQWRFEQFFSQFKQAGAPTWWGARRLERNFGTHWTLALAEAFKALTLPEGVVSQIIPYYLYQKWYSDSRRASGWFNYLAEVGIVYKLDAHNSFYLFWLLDDLRAPNALGGSSITPRKVATLIGARLYPTAHTRLIVEVVRADGTATGGVYDSSGHAPRYAYAYKQLPMGHPIGANRIGLYARVEHEAGRWLYGVDYATFRRFHEYRSGARGYQLGLTVGYQASERSVVGLQYRASRMRDANAPTTRAGWYLQAAVQF